MIVRTTGLTLKPVEMVCGASTCLVPSAATTSPRLSSTMFRSYGGSRDNDGHNWAFRVREIYPAFNSGGMAGGISRVEPAVALTTLAFASVFGIFLSLVPARKASKQDIMDVLAS